MGDGGDDLGAEKVEALLVDQGGLGLGEEFGLLDADRELDGEVAHQADFELCPGVGVAAVVGDEEAPEPGGFGDGVEFRGGQDDGDDEVGPDLEAFEQI
jgi:hypothetical protein